MAQHFLLSSKARELSMVKIMMMSDIEVFEVFRNVRWNTTNGEPVCPCCGSVKKHYF
ncbi:transposase [Arcobacter sp. CECT 8985]|uniref:transposase n=1 Tax=Arcobacter sp. CECT 8985 TaxID=1935424 RepID=UPI002159FA80|nr:transposase [Arcobacter sp. CECT 8985]